MSEKKPDCLLIEYCNFIDYPVGGQLSFAKQMMSVYGNRLALVGVTTDDAPVGKWFHKTIKGEKFLCFNIGRRNPNIIKPVIPDRIAGIVQLKFFKKKIFCAEISNAFVQAPELLMEVSGWRLNSVCYRFPGIENPLEMPRYRWGKSLASLFDRKLFSALKKTDIILACADNRSIKKLVDRSRGSLILKRIVQFPTRVDTEIFYPMDKVEARKKIGITNDKPVIVSCGRINQVKGWRLVIESFRLFLKNNGRGKLIFVGDGEDKPDLQRIIHEFKMTKDIILTGFKPPEEVACYLNASDLAVVGSYKEGWSIAMLEALSCGKPIVSTDVSGAREMIVDGKNGFVLDNRDPSLFCEAIKKALALDNAFKVSTALSKRYALENLRKDLASIWDVLS